MPWPRAAGTDLTALLFLLLVLPIFSLNGLPAASANPSSRYQTYVDLSRCESIFPAMAIGIANTCFVFVQADLNSVGLVFGQGAPSSLPSLTGSVTFSVQGIGGGALQLSTTSCDIQPEGDQGSCSVNITASSPGTVQLNASYSGDANYFPSSSTITLPTFKQPSLVGTGAGCKFYLDTALSSSSGCTIEVTQANGGYCYVETECPTFLPSGTVTASASGVEFSPSSCTLSVVTQSAPNVGTPPSKVSECQLYNSTDVSGGEVTFAYSGDSNFYGSTYSQEDCEQNGWAGACNSVSAPSCGGGGAIFLGVKEGCSVSEQASSNGGSVAISSLSVTGTSPGPVTLQRSLGSLTASTTYQVLDNGSAIQVYCDPTSQTGVSLCSASLGGEASFPVTSDSEVITWSSTSPTGSFSPATCNISASTSDCSVQYRDTGQGTPSVTAVLAAKDTYTSSGTVKAEYSTPGSRAAIPFVGGIPGSPFPPLLLPAVATIGFLFVIFTSYLIVRRLRRAGSKKSKAP
jgi:hypothetical protein